MLKVLLLQDKFKCRVVAGAVLALIRLLWLQGFLLSVGRGAPTMVAAMIGAIANSSAWSRTESPLPVPEPEDRSLYSLRELSLLNEANQVRNMLKLQRT